MTPVLMEAASYRDASPMWSIIPFCNFMAGSLNYCIENAGIYDGYVYSLIAKRRRVMKKIIGRGYVILVRPDGDPDNGVIRIMSKEQVGDVVVGDHRIGPAFLFLYHLVHLYHGEV